MTAIFSLFTLIPMAVLVFLGIFNWRYYYFAYFALYFIFPMLATDLAGNGFQKGQISSGARSGKKLYSFLYCSGST